MGKRLRITSSCSLKKILREKEFSGQCLWAYSRHPNYFFDWFFWISIGLMGASHSWGWVSFTGAFLCGLYLII